MFKIQLNYQIVLLKYIKHFLSLPTPNQTQRQQSQTQISSICISMCINHKMKIITYLGQSFLNLINPIHVTTDRENLIVCFQMNAIRMDGNHISLGISKP